MKKNERITGITQCPKLTPTSSLSILDRKHSFLLLLSPPFKKNDEAWPLDIVLLRHQSLSFYVSCNDNRKKTCDWNMHQFCTKRDEDNFLLYYRASELTTAQKLEFSCETTNPVSHTQKCFFLLQRVWLLNPFDNRPRAPRGGLFSKIIAWGIIARVVNERLK